jgi:hypothetical protein
MTYGGGTPIRCTPMERHAYEMAPVRGTPMKWPMKDARLWDGLCEKHTYERRAYEMALMRDTPMGWSIGDAGL